MTPIHRDPEFASLLRIVAAERRLSQGLIEKDYWVTEVLWALHDAGFEVWFKGGTSLFKGFGLIERFSEDLDMKVSPGAVAALAPEPPWTGKGTQACLLRERYFRRFAALFSVQGAKVVIDEGRADPLWRSASIRIEYPGHYLDSLGGVFAPFVLLEIGSARVTPFVACDLTSFVQEYLSVKGLAGSWADHSPRRVRCVHPLVTLLEKLDAIQRRFPEGAVPASTFVRHFEDAAGIIQARDRLPRLDGYAGAEELALELCRKKQIRQIPSAFDPAFKPDAGPRWNEIRKAHAEIAPIYWGQRIPIEKACEAIREWIRRM